MPQTRSPHNGKRPLRIESLERRQLLAAGLRPASSEDGVWQQLGVDEPVALGPYQSTPPSSVSYLRAIEYETFSIDHRRVADELDRSAGSGTLSIPTPDGTFESFEIYRTEVMAPELAQKYPQIQTYAGVGIDSSSRVRFDISPNGFFAQVRSPEGRDYYVDPYYHLEDRYYASYYESGEFELPEDMSWISDDIDHSHDDDFGHADEDESPEDRRSSADGFESSRRSHEGEETAWEDSATGESNPASSQSESSGSGTAEVSSGTELRTYRTAVAATGEYTQFHGGTVASGLAAIVTAFNRVSGIFEDELSIRLQLIGNNDQLVYTNSGTDPYNNQISGAQLAANQNNIDNVIGPANYDLGHLLVTAGGGLASLNSVGFNGGKARGISGSFNTGNDRFYVNILAHEIGHQFGGAHTFNGNSGACAGNIGSSSAVEPGSGSTIQAYAGICGNDNLQNNSDAYFHSLSLEQMVDHVDNRIPNVGTRDATGNSIPTVEAGLNHIIPARTPFVLTATGQDADVGDVLTYNWEQRDTGPQQDVNAGDNGSSPLFRSFEATTDPTRTFPRLSDLLNNTTVIGETLPTTNRELNFVATVRDNATGGGAFQNDAMKIDVVDTGSPFRVTSPNTAVTFPAQSEQTVSWDVAGTTANGISTPYVDIRLSVDGGNTYPFTLAERVRNDGSQPVVLPLALTSQARVRVEANGNIFFDVSDTNFTIATPTLTSDFGDAPNQSYPTLQASGGAEHTAPGSDVFLGGGVDREADGQENADASGDGIDEDGIFIPEPLVAGTTGQVLVTASGTGVLDYFFDFDGTDGWGNDANEVFTANVTAGTQSVPVTIPADAAGLTFARFRLSVAGGLGPGGVAAGGEVEDHEVEIFAQTPAIDFGDAPDSYGTLRDAGARHIARGPRLGENVDGEADGQPSGTSTDDGRDEDGIKFTELLIRDSTVNVTVHSSVGGGSLDYFFDFDGDGTFGNRPNEIFQANLTGGVETVPVIIPPTSVTGITRARFRISSEGGLFETGPATDGEVEDYQVVILAPGVVGTAIENFDSVTAPNLPIGWSGIDTPTSDWVTATAGSDSQPNHAFNPADSLADDILLAPAFTPVLNRLSFRNDFDIDDGFHGAVLEISVNGGAFQDVEAAGLVFVSGGYTDQISNSFGNPLGGRMGWSGDSGGYIDTIAEFPPNIIGQSVQLRWRLGTDSLGASGDGWRIDSIQMLDDGILRYDYGDAPDPTFPTLELSDGAGHLFRSIRLGAAHDIDTDGQQSAAADGDDNDGSDDDEGVTLPASLVAGVRTTVTVNASEDGLLNAWVDFDADGQWQSDEQIFRDTVVLAGERDLEFDVPPDAVISATTNLRFRLSNQSGLAPNGKAPDGEVEDYQLALTAVPPVVESVVINDGDAQRSGLEKLELTFDRLVQVSETGQPFAFLNTTTNEVPLATSTISNVAGKTVATFAFVTGTSVTGSGSLADGEYQVTIDAPSVTTGGEELDGNDNGTGGDNFVFGDAAVDDFFRKYGDGNGDRLVNLADFGTFRGTFGKSLGDPEYLPEFDNDGNDAVNLADFGTFRANFGT